jgi:uncharacterized protein
MKLIGIEEHFLTPDIRDAWNAINLGATDPSVAFHSGAIESRLFDLAEGRLALMDETGLDVQVLSLTTPALHDLGRESIDMARRTNDALALRPCGCRSSSIRECRPSRSGLPTIPASRPRLI